MNSGASWILDLGPGDLAARLSARELRSRGVGIIATTTRRGHRELIAAGAAPRLATPWSAYAPNVVTLPDGSLHAETRFTRLTGKSPILLAGMTPTTVDAAIVAAAANAGFWAELAGGGQVTEQIFADRVAELDELLDAGQHLPVQLAVPRPVPLEAPARPEAARPARPRRRCAHRRRHRHGRHPRARGRRRTRRRAARRRRSRMSSSSPARSSRSARCSRSPSEVAPTPIIVQIEGGKAGGHHSWEDLDDLLLATYGELRALDNVVVCVGGGIGTPEVAAAYLVRRVGRRHDFPLMPLDGILVGTAAMATLEATTAPDVKQLLVDTRGTGAWVGAGTRQGRHGLRPQPARCRHPRDRQHRVTHGSPPRRGRR